MELTINRDAALDAASFARNAVARRSTIPILGSLLLRARDDGVEFVGTDLDMEAAKTSPAAVAVAGEYALDAERLVGALQSLPAGADVALKLDGERGRVTVQCGRTRFQIPAIPSADFPTFAGGQVGEGTEIPACDIERLIDATEYAVSREMTRPYITGVRLHEIGGKWRAIGTNGTVLSFAQIDCPAALRGAAGQTIPLKAVGQLREMARAADTIAIHQSEALFFARAGSMRLASKVIEQDFPDYQRIIPAAPPYACTVSREPFVQALKRCLSATEARAPAVRLGITSTRMAMFSRGEYGAEAEDEIDAEASGDMEAVFNTRLLFEIASRVAGDDLELRYSNRNEPITVGQPGDETALAVIIGMRTD